MTGRPTRRRAALAAGDPDLNPDGMDSIVANEIPEIFRRCSEMIAARREHPTADLTSVLVHAEIDGQRLEEHEIVMGFFLPASEPTWVESGFINQLKTLPVTFGPRAP